MVERRRRTRGYPHTMSTSRGAACRPSSKKRGMMYMSTSAFSQERTTRTRSGSRFTPKAMHHPIDAVIPQDVVELVDPTEHRA